MDMAIGRYLYIGKAGWLAILANDVQSSCGQLFYGKAGRSSVCLLYACIRLYVIHKVK